MLYTTITIYYIHTLNYIYYTIHILYYYNIDYTKMKLYKNNAYYTIEIIKRVVLQLNDLNTS